MQFSIFIFGENVQFATAENEIALLCHLLVISDQLAIKILVERHKCQIGQP
jgi:hypothetical protein